MAPIPEPKIIGSLGNVAHLNLPKTAFLCSRKVSAQAVLRCYDWAIAQRDAGVCVVSGFHSPLEKDVLHYLLKGQQPIIVACPRGIPKRIDVALQAALDAERLLFVSPFDASVTRVSAETAETRNRLMLAIADDVVVGYADSAGSLAVLLADCSKPLTYL